MGQFIYTKDHKEFKNEKCFQDFINKLKFLAETGITILHEGVEKQVYFVSTCCLGDNLGINTIFGFKGSFVGDYYCRICRATQIQCQGLCEEKLNLLRNQANYTEDLKNSSFGIKTKCIFNQIPFFSLRNKFLLRPHTRLLSWNCAL